ncbi:glycosyltransferase N-terminal domain-containing protein [uncultured Paracoccus sp.]|uniref:3-deoxy-D-manno-octulosonic acid transferase n=1 Tax=uncultured Paracoccus sp. TaxID=189685 RepID=UPI0025D52D46|nr:glycosyltransferase N-terminal domain-containing protein [uncultured Paracoccus sp.]
MAGLAGGVGNLALWLHLRRKAADAAPVPVAAPEGGGPLVIVHLPPGQDDPPAFAQVAAAMRSLRPGLRLLVTGGRAGADDPPGTIRVAPFDDRAQAAQAMAGLSPSALLILGEDLPAAMIAAASVAQVPVILAESRLQGRARGLWQGTLSRGLLVRIDHILIPDKDAAARARSLGGRGTAIEVTGPVTETRPPLGGNEAERQAMAQLLRDRHIWLAATPTRPEALAVLKAHQAALHYNHRALLIVAGLPPAAVPDLLQGAEEMGMATVLRSDDEDPGPDVQVLIAPEDDEMGLWYRLAPVCFMGGTLIEGEGLPPRHPFEPAALGSAIIHGPLPGPHAGEWTQLDGAQAARRIADAEELQQAACDLSLPVPAATLAQNAWNVSTGGAAVVRRIAATVTGAIGARQ